MVKEVARHKAARAKTILTKEDFKQRGSPSIQEDGQVSDST